MKSLKQHITEKLVINNNSKVINYCPKTKQELMSLIEQLIKERGNEADLNDIDVSEIDDMNNLFYFSKFNGDISEWDVSKVTNMEVMFANSKFNGDISKWDISNVKNMAYMFSNSKFNRDISNWTINKKCDVKRMFNDCNIKEEYKPKFNN